METLACSSYRSGGPNTSSFGLIFPHWEGLIHLVCRARRIFNLDFDVDGSTHHLSADLVVGPLIRS
jgi:hypothetical protein